MIEIQNLKVKEICESLMNPRTRFEKADIEELAKNIAEQGLLQPITVRTPSHMDAETFEKIDKDGKAHGFKYEVVCGARRFRAINHLGWKEVPAIVRDMTDAEAFDAMITENLQRKDVDPIDEAVAFSELMRKGQSVKELAARFGKSERYIQDRTKLCGLIKELQKELTKGHIPLIGAIYLAKCDEDIQRDFYKEIDGCFEDDDKDCYPYSDIKDFVTRSFRTLKSTMWMQDDEEESWNDEKDVPKCKGCEFNTASHGCLFYEMKGDAECTRESCFEKKMLVYRRWKLMQMYDKLLKKGEECTSDKVIVIEEECPSWIRDEDKEEFERATEFMKASFPDVKIMSLSDFGGTCYYKEDDERLQKMLFEGEVFKTVMLYDNWHRLSFTFRYKKNVDMYTAGKTDDELMRIDLDKAEEKNTEKLDGELMKVCKDLTNESFEGHKELLDNIVKMIVLDACPYVFKNSAGISDEEKMDALLNDKKRMSEVTREAAREFVTKYSYYVSLGAVRKKVVSELMPETYDELVKKYEEKLEKEKAKIRAKYE